MSKMRVELKVFALILLVLIPLAYFSLSHVPSLYIDSVMLSITDEGMATPYALKGALATYRGKSLVSLSLKKVRRDLEGLALVKTVKVKRKFPSTLLVQATLVSTAVLVHAKGADDETVAAYVLRGSSLLPLQREDWSLFENRTLKVEIPEGYALMMEKYGVDASFGQVMELAASLEGNSTLITRIKYDNNSSNSFGKMVLELSALHAQIWLREPVSVAQVTQAIQLVQEDQRESLSFLSSQIMRYDLYKGAMVRRK
ncbi:MAG TPA: FtsQ-type POTRA domain-containing protein [Sphaerochaeta sp.]|nr:FtsQ-type POTRA domain-containing protein [Sphaerochaeta sp.]